VLRRLSGDPNRTRLPDWEADARFAIAVSRVDVARACSIPWPDRVRLRYGPTPGRQLAAFVLTHQIA
jgi:hypothetical protein